MLVNFTYSWLIFHRMFKGHALKESDLERRRRFADFILTNMTEMNKALSDEATFAMDGMVTSENVRRYFSRK